MADTFGSVDVSKNGATKTFIIIKANALVVVGLVIVIIAMWNYSGKTSSFGNPFMCDDRPGMSKCGPEGLKNGRQGFLNGRNDGPDSAQYTSASNAILQAGVAAGESDSPEGFSGRSGKHSEGNLEGIARGMA